MDDLKRSILLYKMRVTGYQKETKYYTCECGGKIGKKNEVIWILTSHSQDCLQNYKEVKNYQLIGNEIIYETLKFKIIRKNKNGFKLICKYCPYVTDLKKDILFSPYHKRCHNNKNINNINNGTNNCDDNYILDNIIKKYNFNFGNNTKNNIDGNNYLNNYGNNSSVNNINNKNNSNINNGNNYSINNNINNNNNSNGNISSVNNNNNSNGNISSLNNNNNNSNGNTSNINNNYNSNGNNSNLYNTDANNNNDISASIAPPLSENIIGISQTLYKNMITTLKYFASAGDGSVTLDAPHDILNTLSTLNIQIAASQVNQVPTANQPSITTSPNYPPNVLNTLSTLNIAASQVNQVITSNQPSITTSPNESPDVSNTISNINMEPSSIDQNLPNDSATILVNTSPTSQATNNVASNSFSIEFNLFDYISLKKFNTLRN